MERRNCNQRHTYTRNIRPDPAIVISVRDFVLMASDASIFMMNSRIYRNSTNI